MDRREARYPNINFDAKKNTVTLTIMDDDGDEVETSFPAKFEVCPTCEGRGSHVNPSIDSEGISEDDFAEDPEFRENYFGGMYDQQCNECHGLRVVPAVDRDACDAAQQADLAIWEAQEERRGDWDREEAHERMMGY
jgi:excinuclease UvrABC ATPase subunit